MAVLGNDYKEVINSYTKDHWKPLLDLIPIIEKTDKFNEVGGGQQNENGVFTLPYSIPTEIVARFEKVVYEIPIIIGFDWAAWDEGREIARNISFDFDSIDIPTKCKLITAIVRNNRFCDGALISAFESGLILKILKSINNQVIDI
ncbi:MAG TPA: DUF6508 domain-containing protein [Tenuifilaceae bacterium]|nr:DUF6508 domain-containing protein [Tenuifilaceae bacterium]